MIHPLGNATAWRFPLIRCLLLGGSSSRIQGSFETYLSEIFFFFVRNPLSVIRSWHYVGLLYFLLSFNPRRHFSDGIIFPESISSKAIFFITRPFNFYSTFNSTFNFAVRQRFLAIKYLCSSRIYLIIF